jgi:hypothetical protein
MSKEMNKHQEHGENVKKHQVTLGSVKEHATITITTIAPPPIARAPYHNIDGILKF